MSAYTNACLYKCSPHRGNTVVEHSPHHLKVECTSLAAITGTTNVRENYEKIQITSFSLITQSC